MCWYVSQMLFLALDNHIDVQNIDFVNDNPVFCVVDFTSIHIYSTDDDSSHETLSSSVGIDGSLLVS